MNTLLPQIIFYVFSALAVASALMVVTQNNPVRCVLFLVLTFFASSVLWMLQGAEFLALILILVYVGAVMTLFLFVVMMLNIDVELRKTHFMRYLPYGLIIVALLVGLLMVALPQSGFHAGDEISSTSELVGSQFVEAQPQNSPEILSNTEQVGMVLYTDYILAFELAALLLLVAIIAAVTLTQRHLIRSKRQNIKKQLMTDRDDRVRLVAMKSEPIEKRTHGKLGS